MIVAPRRPDQSARGSSVASLTGYTQIQATWRCLGPLCFHEVVWRFVRDSRRVYQTTSKMMTASLVSLVVIETVCASSSLYDAVAVNRKRDPAIHSSVNGIADMNRIVYESRNAEDRQSRGPTGGGVQKPLGPAKYLSRNPEQARGAPFARNLALYVLLRAVRD